MGGAPPREVAAGEAFSIRPGGPHLPGGLEPLAPDGEREGIPVVGTLVEQWITGAQPRTAMPEPPQPARPSGNSASRMSPHAAGWLTRSPPPVIASVVPGAVRSGRSQPRFLREEDPGRVVPRHDDPALWARPIRDERYLLVGTCR